uniref:Uncharacterized protein n=1 Tax=Rhizophora mucronata TaxID=61149 RepID=A0A2P2M270_RHIMU
MKLTFHTSNQLSHNSNSTMYNLTSMIESNLTRRITKSLRLHHHIHVQHLGKKWISLCSKSGVLSNQTKVKQMNTQTGTEKKL